MSKQELEVIGQDTTCCQGLAGPLDEERAAEPAKVFKALGDPVRLRLLSMIASRGEGGEICVCEVPWEPKEAFRALASRHRRFRAL